MLALLLAAALSCGVERHDVKVGRDDLAARIDTGARDKTVHDLAMLPYQEPGESGRGGPQKQWEEEFEVFRLLAVVDEIKHEADNDLHIVLRDPVTGDTMVAEAVLPGCAHGSHFLTQIILARRSAARLKKGQRVIVTGVGFHDRAHNQTGAAPSGLELHPLLSIERSRGVKR